MEDDIDIEEHDVMDNPKVKDMFPDLTVVKTEVLDDEGIDESEDINYYYTTDHIKFENEQNTYYEYNNYYNPPEEEEEGNIYSNKIILGTKPNVRTEEIDYAVKKEYLPAIVVLEDWGDMLKNSPCFCKDCKTLFATNTALDYHRMEAHSFLIAINKAVKSTAKNTVRLTVGDDAKSDCVVRNTMSGQYSSEETEEVFNAESNRQNKLCNHCNKYFQDGTSLIKHLYELLTDSKPKDMMQSTKLKTGKRNVKPHTSNYKCKVCDRVCLTKKGIVSHFIHRHPEVQNIESNILKVNEDEWRVNRKQVTFNFPTDIIYQFSLKKIFVNPPIPISTLFKCVKCDTHFVVCLQAFCHYKLCKNTIRFVKCEICTKQIRFEDSAIHKLQHKLSDEIKVFDTNWKIYRKVLYKCPKCTVCYTDRKFWKHLEGCNHKRVKCIWCPTCSEYLDDFVIQKHEEIHNSEKFAKEDFIYIQLATDLHKDGGLKMSKKRNLEGGFETSQKKIKLNKLKKYQLSYCKSCNTCLSLNRWKRHSRFCKNTKKCVCQKCGLMFSQKNWVKHKLIHLNFNMTLHDFEFFSKDGSKTAPKVVDFFKCNKCKIHFSSKLMVRMHKCRETKYEICHICDKNYDSHAFKLHNGFHTYQEAFYRQKNTETAVKKTKNINTLKYNSLNKMWNVLFMCELCKINTDSYDQAVEHSQNHLSQDCFNLRYHICNICELKFDLKSYKNHLKLHKQLPVNRNDFLILPYKYEMLFKDEWFHLFGKLAMKKVKQIISESLYKDTREVKLRVFKDGRSDCTLFMCKLCKICTGVKDISKHVRKCFKNSNERLCCSKCNVSFDKVFNFQKHLRLHNKITNSEFRVVEFEAISLPANSEFKSKKKDYYTFHKCANCKLSMFGKKTINKHICYFGKTDLCELCGLKYKRKYNHMCLHEKYPNLSRENINISTFRLKKGKLIFYSNTKPNPPIDKTENIVNLKPKVVKNKLIPSKIYLFKCKFCRLVFRSRCSLQRHYYECKGEGVVEDTISSVQNPDAVFFKCSKCEGNFRHLRSLESHTEKVKCDKRNQNLVKCDKCGLSFTRFCIQKHIEINHRKDKYLFKIMELSEGKMTILSG